jgi:hypothetical protein
MAADWLRRRQAANYPDLPVVYCGLANMPAVQAACSGLDYVIWSASYGMPGTPSYGQPHIDDGAGATQYADPAAGSGGHYDLSLCQDDWLQGDEMALPDIDPALVQQFSLAGPKDYVGLVSNYQGVCATYAQQVADLQSQLASRPDCSPIQARLDALKAAVTTALQEVS